MVKVLLVGINARNIHANPALYALCQAARQRGLADMVQMQEYALHTPTQYIMAQIFEERPDILAFSCYIWNISLISLLVRDIRKLLPQTKIFLGGPEASARARHYLASLPVDAVCLGEGEVSFGDFLQALAQQSASGLKEGLPVVPGFLVKGAEDQYQPAPLPDLAQLPFLYDERPAAYLGHNKKIVYYESSRGCPFGCSFCASARQPLRERPLEMVLAELPRLAEIGGQIKFIDRTFNAHPQRAIAITEEVLRLHRKGLSWHFEISPFGLPRELAQLWMAAPDDYIKLEIGVQSLNPAALQAVDRHGDWDKAEPLVKELIDAAGSHVHLDLIAGLPCDTPEGFAASFHRLHQLGADYLQFGFLKVLPGSVLEDEAGHYGLLYSEDPPYQILATPQMSPGYLLALHRAERAFNALYNKTKVYRSQLIDLAERCGDALSIYQRAAELMPPRGLNPAEADRLVAQLCSDPIGDSVEQ